MSVGITETGPLQHMSPHSVQPPGQQSSSTGWSFVSGVVDGEHAAGSASQHTSAVGFIVTAALDPWDSEMPAAKVAARSTSHMDLWTIDMGFQRVSVELDQVFNIP
jgi:hypothetical protein